VCGCLGRFPRRQPSRHLPHAGAGNVVSPSRFPPHSGSQGRKPMGRVRSRSLRHSPRAGPTEVTQSHDLKAHESVALRAEQPSLRGSAWATRGRFQAFAAIPRGGTTNRQKCTYMAFCRIAARYGRHRRKYHGLDHSHSNRNMHRTRDQRLSAGRVLINSCSRTATVSHLKCLTPHWASHGNQCWCRSRLRPPKMELRL
jgi:hypothetical protein